MRIWTRAERTDFGSVLLGSATESSRRRRVRVQILITGSVLVANLVTVTVMLMLVTVGVPYPSVFRREFWWVNFIVIPVYVVFAFIFGTVVGTRIGLGQLGWANQAQGAIGAAARVRAGAAAQRQKAALGTPRRIMLLQTALWLVGAGGATIIYGILDPELITKVGLIASLCAVVVAGVSYLLVEFSVRPVVALAFAEPGPPLRRRRRSGLGNLLFLVWLLGSGVTVIGILAVTINAWMEPEFSRGNLLLSVSILAAITMLVGPLLIYLAYLRISAPLRSVAAGMRDVRDGRTPRTLTVYDGTELGELQIGFNSMVAGIAERERLRDLFGRHVGESVAASALQHGVRLGGETRDVAVLFVDVVGSTTLAATRPPAEVVAQLNKFFAVIVESVNRNGGLLNKFEGDAALVIFGAPNEHDDPAGAALATAREIAAEFPRRVPDLRAGIGVTFGTAVAGNVGAEDRYEYTVIGDAVNEAARLCEIAKRDTSVPLASSAAIMAARSTAGWERLDEVHLRGRTETTRLYGGSERGVAHQIGSDRQGNVGG